MSGPYSIGGDRWQGLSKLIEEAGEVIQVGGKIIGINGEEEHWDGTNLRERMQDELADLLAAVRFFIQHNEFDQSKIDARVEHKFGLFQEWKKKGQ